MSIHRSGFIFLILLSCGGLGAESGDSDAGADAPLPWIDTHAHPLGINSLCDTQTCVEASLEVMDAYGVVRTLFMAPPAPEDARSEAVEQSIRAAVAVAPDRLYYGAGGNLLNSLIQATPDSGLVGPGLEADFEAAFEALAADGDPVVLGEMTALHLSYEDSHAYEETAADTPLFERLADLAASHDLPIDLHLDTVETTAPTPSFFTSRSDSNPAELQPNVPAFEALLEHNREATIVWAHVGRDTTGQLSAALVERLMAAHPNLVIQIHPVFGPLGSSNALVDAAGNIRTEWMDILECYSDRIVLGSDTFYTGEAGDGEHLAPFQCFLEQLPSDLAHRIGCTNPATIYHLPEGC